MSFGLGALTFLTPLALLALIALPILWWLLRATPPSPQRIAFPAIRLLFGLKPKEETPHRTPWWLIVLRLLILSLLIAAAAHPIWNLTQSIGGQGPLLLVVDNGWASAHHWEERVNFLNRMIDEAEREERPILLLPTARDADGMIETPNHLTAAEARGAVIALQPHPWAADRQAAAAALAELPEGQAGSVIWLTDGLASAADADQRLLDTLNRMGEVRLSQPERGYLPAVLLPPKVETQGMRLTALRAGSTASAPFRVRGLAEDGHVLFQESLALEDNGTTATALLTIPQEIRNRLARLQLQGERTVAGTVLIDDRFRRHPVGVVTFEDDKDGQLLLANSYYLERALSPFAEIRQDTLSNLLKSEVSLLLMPDIGSLVESDNSALENWVKGGGALIRFAGPRLGLNAEGLLPVRLRAGDRALGGAMSWQEPAKLAPFPAASPFAGLQIPDDVLVYRQVLAEPEPDLADKSWALLTDGTPIITADKLGEGWLILVHTTANADWSNLALSGLYVEMLQRVLDLSLGVQGGEAMAETLLSPLRSFNGFAELEGPAPQALPIPLRELDAGAADVRHPPGLYGTEQGKYALNLSQGLAPLRPLQLALPYVEINQEQQLIDFRPWLGLAAFLFFLLDGVIALILRGYLQHRYRLRPAAALLLLLALGYAARPGDGWAQNETAPAYGSDSKPADAYIIEALRTTRLAYVKTGAADIDAVSEAGLRGLGLMMGLRTAVEPDEPIGLDLETDELALFPFIYWPLAENQPIPSEAALRRVNEYLLRGGMILFDTRDQNPASVQEFTAAGSGTAQLRRLARGLDIPPLRRVPPDHVLTKSFYLLREFPGRWVGGDVWVEQSGAQNRDAVSSVIIGANDWAGAWAMDERGQFLYPVYPGGERQRETAFRFGINAVLYALTGSYKADQVHVPAILQRLGQ